MPRVTNDGPDGPEEIHLLQAEDREVSPHVVEARKAERRAMKWPAILIVAALVLVVVGLWQEKTLVAGLSTLLIAMLILAACWGGGRR
jgi:hypothetical protein